MYGYIYLTTNTVNGKKYIGKHKGDKLDPKYKGSGTIISKAISKYGFNKFTCEIIDCADSIEELNEKEKHWIQKYNAVLDKNFYNLVTGGDGVGAGKDHPLYGTHRTMEQKEKQSKLMRGSNNPMYGVHICGEQSGMYGVQRFGKDNPNCGNKWSDEQKLNLSKKLKGRKSSFKGMHHSDYSKQLLSDATKKQIQENGHPMKGKHFSEESRKKISDANKLHSAGANNANSKPIVQLDIYGNLINTFSYMKEANKLGFKEDSIRDCCKGKKKIYKGYIWMYLSDYIGKEDR